MHFEPAHGKNPHRDQWKKNHPDYKRCQSGYDRVALRNPSITRKGIRRYLRLYRRVVLQMGHYAIANRTSAQTSN